jgi:hypothetical protein
MEQGRIIDLALYKCAVPNPRKCRWTPNDGTDSRQVFCSFRGCSGVGGMVRIAGAGLAGLACATTLARSGVPVEVYERKSRLLPSSGSHTEGIRNYGSIDAVQELRALGFSPTPFRTVQRTVRRSPNFVNVLAGPAYYLFMRGREADTVDQTLYHEAKANGVRFRWGKSLALSEADVAASGPPRGRFNILGAGYTFSAEGSSLESDTVHALLDNRVAPAGYLVITSGIRFHSIYSVSWGELRFEKLFAMTQAAFEIPWIRTILGTSRWVSKINGRAFVQPDPIATAVEGTTLCVGEAGGFQDAIAGFGFRYAVITGALAGTAIRDGQDYRDLLEQRFGSEFRSAYQFREWLNRATNDDYDKLVASMGREITLKEYLLQRGSRAF